MSHFELSLLPYVECLRKATDKEAEVDCVLKEIDEELFRSTGKRLSKENKINIINRLQFIFQKENKKRFDESTARSADLCKYLLPGEIFYFTDNSKILDALEKTKLKIGV